MLLPLPSPPQPNAATQEKAVIPNAVRDLRLFLPLPSPAPTRCHNPRGSCHPERSEGSAVVLKSNPPHAPSLSRRLLKGAICASNVFLQNAVERLTSNRWRPKRDNALNTSSIVLGSGVVVTVNVPGLYHGASAYAL